jgi:hypothetical protein
MWKLLMWYRAKYREKVGKGNTGGGGEGEG